MLVERRLRTSRGEVFARISGEGPPVLLLHGYPQSHLMWHAVAARLGQYTTVAADLPGYGASFRPAPTENHEAHSKRAMAQDLVEAMADLGFERFAVVGHDRGGRVAYRMALDHPERITRAAVLDIVPTGEVWARADATMALGYWHWPFLAQPAPLPERLIQAAPDAYFDLHVRAGLGLREDLDVYRRMLHDPQAVQAICEDYRAGATIDREHDADHQKIVCPLLVLWGEHGALPRFYGDVLNVWRPWATRLTGASVEAGHFLAEEEPEQTAALLNAFLSPGTPPRTGSGSAG